MYLNYVREAECTFKSICYLSKCNQSYFYVQMQLLQDIYI